MAVLETKRKRARLAQITIDSLLHWLILARSRLNGVAMKLHEDSQ
jgi:hypothetical protein